MRTLGLTEQENTGSTNIDKLPTIEALNLFNREDAGVAAAVAGALPEIAAVIEKTVERLGKGGRVFYVGAGTSGRLGVLDASELPPTFGVSSHLFQGVIAGGYEALYQAAENSEDLCELAEIDLLSKGIRETDVIIGIAASGDTPYTVRAVEFARENGCLTACITCSPKSAITRAAEISIVAAVGPEVITGSTRLKAGTAQKMILNMISTVTMIRLGYVRGNRMTNLKSSNSKLRLRSLRILMSEANMSEPEAVRLLTDASDDLRAALVMNSAGVDFDAAKNALIKTDYVVDKAVNYLLEDKP